MAKILIPTPLRQFTATRDSVTVHGATVGEVLAALTTEFPDLRKQIFTDEGKLRSFVNVYLDRKSTRLNSSHLVISYAVFCLKKKNTVTPVARFRLRMVAPSFLLASSADA